MWGENFIELNTETYCLMQKNTKDYKQLYDLIKISFLCLANCLNRCSFDDIWPQTLHIVHDPKSAAVVQPLPITQQ